MNIEDARKYFDKIEPSAPFDEDPELAYRYLREKYVELLGQYKTWMVAYLNLKNRLKGVMNDDDSWVSAKGLL